MPNYSYAGGSYAFPYDSGVFLCSELVGGGGQRHGVLLQYKSGQDRAGGLVTDITLPVFLGRPKAVMEIGQVLFNAVKLSYMFQRGQGASAGNTGEDAETAIRGIISDMYNGYGVRYQDAIAPLGGTVGNSWFGGLVVTPDCFSWLTNPAYWVSFNATFYEVGT